MKRSFLAVIASLTLPFLAIAQQSEIITFVHDELTVNGVLTKPNGNGRFPVVIINGGTGANDKDCTLPMTGGNVACLYPGLLNTTLYPYKELGDALTDSGYAVLRYDKLEYTYSGNPSTLGAITFHKLWLPVESAINYVKTRSDIDTNQIILLGHSEGSSMIPYIAKNRSDIKALISLGGSRTPLDSLLAYQLPYIAYTCGGDTALANMQAAQILAYFADIRNGNWTSSTPALMGVPANTWANYIHAADSVSIHYNSCNLPTLFVGFGLDINVPPAELVRLQNEVTITNDFWSISNLIHYMTPNNMPHVSETLTDTVIHWLRQKSITHASALSTLSRNADISPNPFSEGFTISLKNVYADRLDIRMTDAKGTVILTKSFENIKGDFRTSFAPKNTAPGVYFLHLKADGDTTVKRLVKE